MKKMTFVCDEVIILKFQLNVQLNGIFLLNLWKVNVELKQVSKNEKNKNKVDF